MEKNKKNILGYYIIGSALLWGLAILGCALILKESFAKISMLLTGFSAVHLIVIWVPLAGQLKKWRKENLQESGTEI